MEQKLTTKEEYLKRINVIVEYINNHLDENIDLGMLAEMSGFSPWHFHRIVRAFLGEPVGAFITRVRVETAARLLRYSDLSVQDLSLIHILATFMRRRSFRNPMFPSLLARTRLIRITSRSWPWNPSTV